MESRQPEVYAAVTITLVAATAALVLRIIARKMKKLALWFDDYLVVFAWVAALAYDIATYIWLDLGLGLHIHDLNMAVDLANHYRELFQFIMEQAYTVSIAGSQLSLLALYWRAFGPALDSRMGIVVIAACSISWFLSRCNPPEAKWNHSVQAVSCPIDTGKFFLATVTAHLIIDILLMILPAWQIRKLHLPLLEKLSITALFLFGCVVCFSSAKMMVAGITYDATSDDVFWLETDAALWSAVEINLSIITVGGLHSRPHLLSLPTPDAPPVPAPRVLHRAQGFDVVAAAPGFVRDDQAAQRGAGVGADAGGCQYAVSHHGAAADGVGGCEYVLAGPGEEGYAGHFASPQIGALWSLGGFERERKSIVM
ncbi:hypothetical protein PG985_001920 [Apiospora marii]|uniref:uncharacterized protein n=1 Tax=Apiospora marii TaxID=335849 RepID=UPI00312F94A6